MKKEVEILKKPNQVIMLNNGEITASQRKIYTTILYQAQQELKKDNKKTYFTFNYMELKEKAGTISTNNWSLKKDIQVLKRVEIETSDDKDNWGGFSLISDYRKLKDSIEIELPRTIRESIVNNDYYTAIDMLTIRSLSGKYSIILYEVALRYEKVKIPKMSIEEFRELTGTTDCYKDFRDIRIKVLEYAIKEINEKTDIILSYDLSKKGMKVTHIKLKMSKKKKEEEPIQEVEKVEIVNPKNKVENTVEYSDEVLNLFDLLPDFERVESRKKEIAELLKEHTFNYLKSDIEYCNEQRPEKYWSYFVKSVNSGHFSAVEIEKAEKIKEQKKEKEQREIKEIERQEMEKEQINELAEKVYNALTEEMMEEYTEKSGYEKLPVKFRKNFNLKDMIMVLIKKEIEEEMKEATA